MPATPTAWLTWSSCVIVSRNWRTAIGSPHPGHMWCSCVSKRSGSCASTWRAPAAGAVLVLITFPSGRSVVVIGRLSTGWLRLVGLQVVAELLVTGDGWLFPALVQGED